MPSKKCEAEGCSKWASFNLPGLKRPLYCRPHSSEGMVNVVSRQRCTFPECPKQANFNHPGETRGLFCKEHIEEGMIDVRHKHCMHPGCPKQATCNQPGAGGGMFCGQHKLDGMVNVVLKRCAHEGCETFPSFGHPGQPGVQYCRLHKLPGMQRRTSSTGRNAVAVEMMPERCAHPGCCEPRPLFCMSHVHEQAHEQHLAQQQQLAQQQHLAQQQQLAAEGHPHLTQEEQVQQYHEQLQHQHQHQHQQDVHSGEHQLANPQQHLQLGPMDGQMQHHLAVSDQGLAASYTAADMNAWANQGIAHGMPADAAVAYQHQATVPDEQQYVHNQDGGPIDAVPHPHDHQHEHQQV